MIIAMVKQLYEVQYKISGQLGKELNSVKGEYLHSVYITSYVCIGNLRR